MRDIIIIIFLGLVLGMGAYASYSGLGITSVKSKKSYSHSVRTGSVHTRYIYGGGYFFGK